MKRHSVLIALKSQGWAFVWTIFILILCSIKMPASEEGGAGFFFVGFDKMVHLGFFYVLTILLFYGKIKSQHNYNFRLFTIFKIVFITAGLGAFIEVLQLKFFTYRSAEWWDFICDMFGVMMGVFSYILLHKSDFYEKKS